VPQMPLRNLPTSGTVLAISRRARRVQRTVVYGVSAKAAVTHTPCGGIAMCNFCGVSCVLVYGCAETRSDERAG
jgi:hypothetical protein